MVSVTKRERYHHDVIEQKWQERWAETNLFALNNNPDGPKWYAVTMYPYPSGDLHIGHWYAMTPSDSAARYKRMRGYNVFFPMGFDAFGLPAENAAIQRNIHPMSWTISNMENMQRQMGTMGTMFDWTHSLATCLPDYYKWNQWFFLKFMEQGLAYKKEAPVWWCPKDQTVLANEQVVDGKCERCGTTVYQQTLAQWFFRITHYAEELLNYDGIEWPENVKLMQRNWIGRSDGARVTFLTEAGDPIEVFTTRPDTLWGATFMVLAPEHPLVDKLTTPEQRPAIDAYINEARRMSEIDRQSTEKEKTGVATGGYAINPVSGERVPVWIADYVLMTYGTGAIMAVPAHDERDFEFATKFGLPIIQVIEHPDPEQQNADEYVFHHETGTMMNSGELTGTPGDEAIATTIAWLEQRGLGTGEVTYRMRDWGISRQRYWGTPIPIIYCDNCGIVPVPYEDLPVILPDDSQFTPTGKSPLQDDARFLNVECPTCGGPGRRESDTMDTFVDSSWYQYRYLSPDYADGPFDPAKLDWLPVDQYTGGIEHATMHLLYTRFFTKAMRDMGLVNFDEPFLRLFNQGIILGEDSEKMSKSRGNVVDPDELVFELGADTVRLFLMFLGPWDRGAPWDPRGIAGPQRFLDRTFFIVNDTKDNPAEQRDDAASTELRRLTHRTIKDVTADLDEFAFNTAIAKLMEFVNELHKLKETEVASTAAWHDATDALLLMLAPLTPHIAEELWERKGRPFSIHNQLWPEWDEALAAADTLEIAVLVNGKVRDRIEIDANADAATAIAAAKASEKVQQWMGDFPVLKEIYVPGRQVAIVVKGTPAES